MPQRTERRPQAMPGTDHRLTPVLTKTQTVRYGVAIALWAVCVGFFTEWWFRPEHNIDTGLYILATLPIYWVFFLQAYFLTIFMRMRRSTASLDALKGARVAMVVTKSPSEPFTVVCETLEGMLAQRFPHDTWLADEDPSPETVAWCQAKGVQISTRKGREDYHRATWPRRTRCKEGNLAFFYDSYGYQRYDFVAQLDADHVPQPSYLEEMLRPFADRRVGYVSAPSICGSNAEQSWAARSRLYGEAMFHGALQAGYSNGWAPMCIGSHYAVRTEALKQIGGLGPELAEDHSTSMMMNAVGWRGVHAIDAIAFGAGPDSLSDMVTQEFQWSRSLVTILLSFTRRYLSGLPPVLKFQFVFSQLFYPLFSLFMLLIYLIPTIALAFDVRFADVTYPAFIGHAIPATAVLIWLAFDIRRQGLFRPAGAKVIAWEKALFPFAQWPWVLWGSMMAVRDWITGKFVDFRVTPKGTRRKDLLPYRVLAPYAALALGAILPAALVNNVSDARGFYLFALFNAALYIALLLVILTHHIRENSIPLSLRPAKFTAQFAGAFALMAFAVYAVDRRGAESLQALSFGLEPVQIVEVRFVVSGAGQGGSGKMKYTIRPGIEKNKEGRGSNLR